MSEHETHLSSIVASLTRMHVYASVRAFEVLQGGISGSSTYRVQLEDRIVVLKATQATAPPYVIDRANREYAFYHELASQVPLRVPLLLAAHQDPNVGTDLLLAALRPVPPPRAWQACDYARAVEQLAGLHARFWRQADRLVAAHIWLQRPAAKTDPVQVEQGLAAWQSLAGQHRLQEVLSAPVWRALDRWIKDTPALDALIEAFPITLCHGDCHIGNLLQDEAGTLVWADWQEVSLACGPGDLSFLIQRATHDGARVPWQQMVADYQRHLSAGIGEPVSLAAIQQTMDALELRTRLLQWPFYLAQASTEQIAGMVSQIQVLADRLQMNPDS